MSLLELRILPPLAVARLGASETPLESYRLVVDAGSPLGYRTIVPDESLKLDIETGEITGAYTPARIRFRDGDKIRPVAPFLEVFARTADEVLEPLTVDLLRAHGLTPADVTWTVHLGNRKIARRTRDPNDRIEAKLDVTGHDRHAIEATSQNFQDGKVLPLGWVQYVRPTGKFPEIRLRYTPAAGYVYGAAPDDTIPTDRAIYDAKRGHWVGYEENDGKDTPVQFQTIPGAIFASNAVSLGYFDDECDGIVSVALTVDGKTLSAFARLGAGPPTFAPDAIPIRTIADELAQAAFGTTHEDPATLEEAEEIVRRAVETVRLLNVAVMNGNLTQSRTNAASTMARQDANDFLRYFAPIMAPAIVDNHAILALHQNVLAALRSGTGAWFADALRRPEEVGDLSDLGRRKMPALMRGAEGRHLVLTRRQIDAVVQAAIGSFFAEDRRVGS